MKHFSLSFLYSNIPLNIQKCVIITLKKKKKKNRRVKEGFILKFYFYFYAHKNEFMPIDKQSLSDDAYLV